MAYIFYHRASTRQTNEKVKYDYTEVNLGFRLLKELECKPGNKVQVTKLEQIFVENTQQSASKSAFVCRSGVIRAQSL